MIVATRWYLRPPPRSHDPGPRAAQPVAEREAAGSRARSDGSSAHGAPKRSSPRAATRLRVPRRIVGKREADTRCAGDVSLSCALCLLASTEAGSRSEPPPQSAPAAVPRAGRGGPESAAAAAAAATATCVARGRLVHARRREAVAVAQHVGVDKVEEDVLDRAPVPVVGDAAAVVDLGGQLGDDLEGDDVVDAHAWTVGSVKVESSSSRSTTRS